MKNALKFLGIIALAAVIGFSMAACGGGEDDDDGDPNGNGNGNGGTPTVISWIGLSANGTANYTDTTELTLTFDKDPVGLSASNVTVTGANKGSALTGNGITRTLTIGHITVAQGENVTVALTSPSGGYTITPSSKTVAINKITWTAVADNTFGESVIRTIAYGNNMFVAAGGNKMATSADGVTWTTVDFSGIFGTGNGGEINAIAYGNNMFVAGGSYRYNSYSSNGKMATSTDGTNWTSVDVSGTFGYSQIYAIAYGNGKFVAGGEDGKMAYSTDGVTWTAVDVTSIFSTSRKSGINAIAYGNNKFVAVGGHGNGDYEKMAAYSTDGITWTGVDVSNIFNGYTNVPLYGISAIAYGNDKFVAVGGYMHDGRIAYSTDGTTWTAISSSSHKYAIAYGNGKFVAGGYDGYMEISADGITWTYIIDSTFSSDDIDIIAIAYGNNKFVAGGYGKMAYWQQNN